MSTKGIALVQGQVATLALDGTLVYVEAVEPTFAAVVALPEQPAEATGRVFTPGKVGAKKISPFSQPSSVVSLDSLSPRNRDFIGSFEQLRTQHGPNHVDRTPEEQAAFDKANAPQPTREDKAKARAEAREQAKAAKAARKASAGPKYLQRCTACGEQPAHPNHSDGVCPEFKAPEAPVVSCAACDEVESHELHAKPKEEGGHRFVAGKAPKATRQPREPREPRVKAERQPRGSKKAKLPEGTFVWGGNDAGLDVLASGNPKYNEGNSGRYVAQVVKDAGDAGIDLAGVAGTLATHPKFGRISFDRIQVALTQLFAAQLITVKS